MDGFVITYFITSTESGMCGEPTILYFSSAVILLLIVAAIIYKSIHNIIIAFIFADNHAKTQDFLLSCIFHMSTTFVTFSPIRS